MSEGLYVRAILKGLLSAGDMNNIEREEGGEVLVKRQTSSQSAYLNKLLIRK